MRDLRHCDRPIRGEPLENYRQSLGLLHAREFMCEECSGRCRTSMARVRFKLIVRINEQDGGRNSESGDDVGRLGVVPATGQPNKGQRPIDLLVIGDVNSDLIVRGAGLTPSFGQVETLVDGTALTVSGSGSITACGAARLGLSIAIAGLIGVDLFGEFMPRALDERGVDTRGLIADPTLSTGLTVILDRGEDRAILTHPGTIAQMTTDRVKPELLALARHIRISSYYLQTALWTGFPKLLRTARRQGATISIDPNRARAGAAAVASQCRSSASERCRGSGALRSRRSRSGGRGACRPRTAYRCQARRRGRRGR